MNRRNFLISGGLCVLSQILLGNRNISASNLEQRIEINLPAYSLRLIDYTNNSELVHLFKVGIGKGGYGRRQTPIGEGFIDEKREKIILRYGQDYPLLNLKKGDIINWTNTFDEHGNPMRYKMPYEKMRGLSMKIKNGDKEYHKDFVIHSTTDEFTIKTPSSDGCIRVGIKDMLTLYDLIAQQTKNGKTENIPLKILYNLVEIGDNTLIIHADIYNKNIDYVEEIKKVEDIIKKRLNYSKLRETLDKDKIIFKETHEKILKILSNSWPNNFIQKELKRKLHNKYNIEEF